MKLKKRAALDPASAIAGIGAGLGLMYLFDPAYGTRRRALIRDKAVRFSHAIGDAADVVAKDSYNRARGLTALVSRSIRREPVDDDILVERVRSELGRSPTRNRSMSRRATEGSFCRVRFWHLMSDM